MSNNTNRARKTNTNNSSDGAKKFLCAILAFIVAFIGIVCFSVHKRNDSETSNNTKQGVTNGNNTNQDITTPENSYEASENSSEYTEDANEDSNSDSVTTAAPGTIDAPVNITIDADNWHLTLVNSGYLIPSDYSPDLVYVCGSGERLDSKVAEHYEAMYDAAEKDGVYLTPCSGYRPYEVQERNYNNKVAFFESQGYSTEDAKVKAATIIMPPGSSEHNLGYAMDIVCVDEWFEDTEEFKWLQENAADYGFIMRYPEDKQDITKVIYEPWHWRYVGVDAAKEMNASGLVLEEYLGVA